MVYLVAFLGAYFIVSLFRVVRSFSQEKKVSASKDKAVLLKKETDALRAALDESKAREAKNKKEIASLTEEISGLDKLLCAESEKASQIKMEAARKDHALVALRRGESWATVRDLESKGFHLSEQDFNTIVFPPLDPAHVYYAKKAGSNYHAVKWCYRLDFAHEIADCPLSHAEMMKLFPCVVCVERKQLKELKK